ncbi:MAG: signal peptidase I [Bacilli bacterium]|nr:signal peptidase I [Bacilli bacterium]
MKKVIIKILEYGSIVLAVILIRIFIVTPVQVDGISMNDTLHDNDIMILNIIKYKFNDIKRFDIVVIDYEEADEYLIKRVIGLPGEYIEYKDNKLYIDGKYIKEPYLDTTTYNFNLEEYGYSEIPKDTYFVMGDNRKNSTDSRVIGFINKKDIKGSANLVIFPFNHFGVAK